MTVASAHQTAQQVLQRQESIPLELTKFSVQVTWEVGSVWYPKDYPAAPRPLPRQIIDIRVSPKTGELIIEARPWPNQGNRPKNYSTIDWFAWTVTHEAQVKHFEPVLQVTPARRTRGRASIRRVDIEFQSSN